MNRVLSLVALLAVAIVGCSTSTSAPNAATGPAPSAYATSRSTGTVVRTPSTLPSLAATDAGGRYPSEQIGEAGPVTVSASWNGPEDGVVFELTLNTHSVALDAFTLADAVLRNDRGDTLAATPWNAPAGGHHRSGELAFTGDPTTFLTGARSVELVLYNIADTPEIVLHWDL